MKTIQISTMTSPGPKKENQDDLAIWTETTDEARKEAFEKTYQLDNNQWMGVAVADGVSAAAKAQQSSALTVESLMGVPHDEDIPTLFRRWLNASNQMVSALNENEYRTVGASTLCCGLLTNETLYCANVGDSPIFRIRNHQIEQLAQMQTVAMMKRSMGMDDISVRDEHTLINFIGNNMYRGEDQMYRFDSSLEPGDIYIFCSDGVPDALGENNLMEILEKEDASAITLIEKAQSTAQDNISAIVIKILD